MSTLLATRKAIADKLRTELTGVVSVVEHGGAVTLDELKRVALNAPALLVACLGVPTTTRSSVEIIGHAAFVVFVVTQDGVAKKRDAVAMALAEAVMAKAATENWGTARRAPDESDLIMNNLFSTALDKTGLALWAVRWRQEVLLAAQAGKPLDDFKTFYGTYDINSSVPGSAGDVTEDNTELPQ